MILPNFYSFVNVLIIFLLFAVSEIVSESNVDLESILGEEYFSIDKWAVTNIKVKKQKFAWLIDNFNFNNKQNSEAIESPIFSDNSDDGYQWRFKFFPRGHYSSSSEILMISLLNFRQKVVVISKISYLNDQYQLVNLQTSRVDTISSYSDVIEYTLSEDSTTMNSYSLHTLRRKNTLPFNKRLFVVELAFDAAFENSTSSCGLPRELTPRDFTSLLDDSSFSDMTFKVDSTEIKAHRAIVAAASPVLRREIDSASTGSSEDQSINLEVVDAEPSVFRELLRHMYGARVEILGQTTMARQLLRLAQFYELPELERQCERVLCQTLDTDNAMDLLDLANKTNATYLKARALKYITQHSTSMLEQPGFASLLMDPQNLVAVIRNLT